MPSRTETLASILGTKNVEICKVRGFIKEWKVVRWTKHETYSC